MDQTGQRREQLRRTLESSDAEALLVSSTTNVRYLTGFTGDSSVLLMAPGRDLLISDGRFTTQIEQECPGLEAYIRPSGHDLNHAIIPLIGSLGLRRLAFEATSWTVADYETIRDGVPGVSLIGVRGWVEALRRIKDESEIAAIRETIRYAERAFVMVRAGLRMGETEKDVADALEILRGDHRHHTRHGPCRGGADGSNYGMGVRRAHECAVQHAGKAQVVGIVADPLDEPWIFFAFESLPYPVAIALAIALAISFSVAWHGSPPLSPPRPRAWVCAWPSCAPQPAQN
jgi:Xaa-Pro aminopeptidase